MTWDSTLYDSKHSYVSRLGEDLVALLAPRPGERILDLGCGTGHLARQIGDMGAEIVGLDKSPDMIAQAQANYPSLQFVIGDGANFHFDEPFDAVFSNAALHWMPEAEAVAARVYQALKPGGRFVAEFGGKGNIRQLLKGLYAALKAADFPAPQRAPWYFPSLGEYASLLERQGFWVQYAILFDRPTPLEGEEGMRNWLFMFAGSIVYTLPAEARDAFIQDVENRLRPVLYREGVWSADYRRLRIAAVKSKDS